MAKERGLFRLIFKEFINSITPRIPKRVHVGTDYMGTKYFEVTKEHSIRRKSSRYFIPVNKQNFDQELPAEWEAWLRKRRQEPPSEDEVNENYKIMLLKKKNAAALEATYAKETGNVTVVDPSGKPPNEHVAMNFPVYDEYKNHGQNDTTKGKK